MKAWFLPFRSKNKKPGAMILKWSGTDLLHVRAPIPPHACTFEPAELRKRTWFQLESWERINLNWKKYELFRGHHRLYDSKCVQVDTQEKWPHVFSVLSALSHASYFISIRLFHELIWLPVVWHEHSWTIILVLFYSLSNIFNRLLFFFKFSSFMRSHTSDLHTIIAIRFSLWSVVTDAYVLQESVHIFWACEFQYYSTSSLIIYWLILICSHSQWFWR